MHSHYTSETCLRYISQLEVFRSGIAVLPIVGSVGLMMVAVGRVGRGSLIVAIVS